MRISIQVMIDDEHNQTHLEEMLQLDKGVTENALVGLSLAESKQLLKTLQATVVQYQAQAYAESHRRCPHYHKVRRIKGYTTIQYRTLFGIVPIKNQRLYR